jgi:hypothetical protein
MARRPGKATSRKARQRYVPRQPRPAPPVAPTNDPGAETSTSVEAPEPRRAAPAPVSAPRPAATSIYSTGSSLTARERADYHYVERDLRNIGILTAIMAALLLGAWLLFTATGLVG